jgi:hypothetical protein
MGMNPRLLRPTASGFNPRTIAGIEAWWDAADSSKVTLDSGRVATFADKSGKGRDATNNTSGSTQPQYITGGVNGRNSIRLVTADNTRLGFSSFAIPASHTVFGAFTRPTAGTRSGMISNNSASPNDRYALHWFTDNNSYQKSNAGFTSHGTASNATGTFLVTTRRTGTTSQLMRRNGSVLSNVTSGTGVTNAVSGDWDSLGVAGSGQFFNGDLCEIIVYSAALTDSQVTIVERYLAAKWGVTLA